MSKFTITLNDGKRLENITMNGGMFVSPIEITPEDLNAEALAHVTVTETDDESNTVTRELTGAICDGVLHWPEGWLFNLRVLSPDEIERKALLNRLDEAETALIELAAMIGDVM